MNTVTMNEDSVESRQYKSILNLPNNVNHLLVLTPKDQTFNVIRDAVQKGIRYIWIQQSSETPEAIEYATKDGISLITGQCIFMFVNPKGMHKFHYQLKRLFKSLPA